jgi:hypothetical protein
MIPFMSEFLDRDSDTAGKSHHHPSERVLSYGKHVIVCNPIMMNCPYISSICQIGRETETTLEDYQNRHGKNQTSKHNLSTLIFQIGLFLENKTCFWLIFGNGTTKNRSRK